jgi:putative ABC transport system permease protein
LGIWIQSKRSVANEIDMLNEIKGALCRLLKSPGFSAIAIPILALAVGATTAVVSLVNVLLVRPLPYQDPSKLMIALSHNA